MSPPQATQTGSTAKLSKAPPPRASESDTKNPAETEAPKEAKLEQATDARVKPAEFARNIWVMVAHATNSAKDLLKPEFWAHVAQKLKRHDRIEAWADNGLWYAELLVLDSGRGWARVHLLQFADLQVDSAPGQTIQKGGYEIIWRGEHHKWSVVRLSDKEVVSEGHGTQGPAVDWLDERLKVER